MATYSAFFSSGLLASSYHPHQSYSAMSLDEPTNDTNSSSNSMNMSMSITPTKPRSPKSSSTLTATSHRISALSPCPAIADDSDIEDRDGTPIPARTVQMAAVGSHPTPLSSSFTPSSYSSVSSMSSSGSSSNVNNVAMTTTRMHKTSDPSRPVQRLRRRRSSLTVGAAPITAIKSSARNAEAAANLQRHLAMGSASGAEEMFGAISAVGVNVNVSGGRQRSGSLGGLLSGMRITGQHVEDEFFAAASSSRSRSRSGSINTQTVGNKTMLMRMRSGSLGAKGIPVSVAGIPPTTIVGGGGAAAKKIVSGASATGLLRPRRPIRRAISSNIVQSATPPPNMPLPALPPVPPAPAPLSFSRRGSPSHSPSRMGSREVTPVAGGRW